MKRAEPRHALDDLAEHDAHPDLHLARRLVGEGHGEDLGRPSPSGGEDMRYARGENPRFSGSRAGQHEHRSIERFHRKALLGIETIEIRGTCSCPRAGGNAVRLWHEWRRVAREMAGVWHSRSMIGRLAR